MRNCGWPSYAGVDSFAGVDGPDGCFVRARDEALDVPLDGTSAVARPSEGPGDVVLLGFLGLVSTPYRIRH